MNAYERVFKKEDGKVDFPSHFKRDVFLNYRISRLRLAQQATHSSPSF